MSDQTQFLEICPQLQKNRTQFMETGHIIKGIILGVSAIGKSHNSQGTPPQPSTNEAGYMAYYEICDKINQGWTEVYDEQMMSAYAYGDDQWIGYETPQSMQHRYSNITCFQ